MGSWEPGNILITNVYIFCSYRHRSEYYSVERLVGKRVQKGKVYYLIKWKDYGDEHNTWEPEEHCGKARKMIMQYEATMNGSLNESNERPSPRKKIKKSRNNADLVRSDFQNQGTSGGNPGNMQIVNNVRPEQQSTDSANDNTVGNTSTKRSTTTEASDVEVVKLQRRTEASIVSSNHEN